MFSKFTSATWQIFGLNFVIFGYQFMHEIEKKDKTFIEESNFGGEFMSQDRKDKVNKIASYHYKYNGSTKPFLSDNEVYNLCISRGTLTPEERKVINDHIVVTIEMLEQLPYPKHLRNVPEFAGGQHEKLDGTGYPTVSSTHLPLPTSYLV